MEQEQEHAQPTPLTTSFPDLGSGPSTDEEVDPSTTVYGLLHALNTAIVGAIETSLTWEELQSAGLNYTVVRPIIEQFAPKNDKDSAKGSAASLGAVLYALMANRIHFISLADADLSYVPLQTTRASFCELLAIKMLRTWPNPENEAELATELVRTYGALDGAPEDVWASVDEKEDSYSSRQSALELAILSGAKTFLSQPLVQHLVAEIYKGHLVYAPAPTRAIIPDQDVTPRRGRGKRARDDDKDHSEEVYPYNPYEAGWLDYTRLRVPRWRRWREFIVFATLIILLVTTLVYRHLKYVPLLEYVFILFAFGFILDEMAGAHESGFTVYLANAWNTFDLAFMAIFLVYFVMRIISLVHHSRYEADLALDILACGACFLFPRLVFFFIRDNVVVIALRGMVLTYVRFMALTAIAFSGTCFCLWRLAADKYTFGQVLWLMMRIWFGGASVGWNAAENFHPILGPIILTTYAMLCSTFLITTMMSFLSGAFQSINANARQELLFQRVVGTVEDVRGDAIFSYIPPFNIPAVIILLPLSAFASQETVHEVNVFLLRVTSFPVLVAISAYERARFRSARRALRLTERGIVPEVHAPGLFQSFLGSGSKTLIQAAFEITPPARPAAIQAAPKNDPERAEASSPTRAPPAKDKSKKFFGESSLAKLYRKDSSKPAASGGTVTVSAEEWAQVRESQKRLEDMLKNVLAVMGTEVPESPESPKSSQSPKSPQSPE